MITKVITGDVFKTDLKHIAFAINTDGYNDSGFAGQVCSLCPGFADTGEEELGTIISIKSGDKMFHGLVCHSLKSEGWKDAPEAIVSCLDNIQFPDSEPIAVVLMGAGMIGQMSGADVKANIRAIHQSKKNCVVYSFEYGQNAIFNVIIKE